MQAAVSCIHGGLTGVPVLCRTVSSAGSRSGRVVQRRGQGPSLERAWQQLVPPDDGPSARPEPAGALQLGAACSLAQPPRPYHAPRQPARAAALPRCEPCSSASSSRGEEGGGGVSRFYTQLDEPPSPPPPSSEERQKDFFANVGDAIRTLREDIPLLFAKDLNYEIYREDIVFRDPNITFKGLKNYKLIFWSLRFHGRLFLRNASVDVLRIWQPEDNQIKMRWRVHGHPRVWWEAEGVVDGISVYRLDREGKIYEHAIDNVQLRDPPITNPVLYALNYLWPRPAVNQVPCPFFTDEPEDLQSTVPMAVLVPRGLPPLAD